MYYVWHIAIFVKVEVGLKFALTHWLRTDFVKFGWYEAQIRETRRTSLTYTRDRRWKEAVAHGDQVSASLLWYEIYLDTMKFINPVRKGHKGSLFCEQQSLL